jgi:ATP-dependent Lon protease
MRSIGLEPERMSRRLKFHYLARLFCFVEANYNFIELGPRGTGKSYAFSEFSPYSTLVSQASTPTLFYNNARHKVGLVGYWDVVAFDEVARVKVKDKETIDILKSYMASGRFSRGVEVVAKASLAFVGNIDFSIEQLVNSDQFDLFIPLPKEFDLAVMDRFFTYLPGWEIPKNSSDYLTGHYGFITDYLSEAFHLLARESRYDYVTKQCKFGPSIEGRDEIAVKRTVAAFLKLLHPTGESTREELEEYMAYALEARRRIKEQLNKRKHDDEYARINLSYIDSKGNEIVVWCPESKNAPATQQPLRKRLPGSPEIKPREKAEEKTTLKQEEDSEELIVIGPVEEEEPKEDHYTIFYGDTGHSYQSILGRYLEGSKSVLIEDPYIRLPHQMQNLVRFSELLVRMGTVGEITLTTGFDNDSQKAEVQEKFEILQESLRQHGIDFKWSFSPVIHDRAVRLDNGWVIKIGRGFDIYQPPDNWFSIGSQDLSQRPCLETTVDIYRER